MSNACKALHTIKLPGVATTTAKRVLRTQAVAIYTRFTTEVVVTVSTLLQHYILVSAADLQRPEGRIPGPVIRARLGRQDMRDRDDGRDGEQGCAHELDDSRCISPVPKPAHMQPGSTRCRRFVALMHDMRPGMPNIILWEPRQPVEH